MTAPKSTAPKATENKTPSGTSHVLTTESPVVTFIEPNSIKAQATHGSRLSTRERKYFSELQKTVRDGLTAMFEKHIEVGNAMSEIKEKKLYREKFETWAEYCSTVFNVARSRSYELIGAAQLVGEMSAMADLSILPLNERQIRPLTALKEFTQKTLAWKRALELAGENAVSEANVREAVKAVKAEVKKASAPIELKPDDVVPDWKSEISQRFLDRGFEAVIKQPFAWPDPVADFKSKDSDRFVKLIEVMDVKNAACAIQLVETHSNSIVVVCANANMDPGAALEVAATGDIISVDLPLPLTYIAKKMGAILEDDGSFYAAPGDGEVVWQRLSTEELTALGLTNPMPS